MNAWLSAWLRCIGADVLKLRRTSALALAGLLPALPPLLFFVYLLQRGDQETPDGVRPIAWSLQGMASLWAIFLVPPFVAIETSLLAGIEHHNGGWKRLLSLPVPRSAVYAAKYVVGAGLMAAATVAICAYTMLSLWGLVQLRADAGFTGPLPFAELLLLYGLIGVASLFVLSVHGYVAMRWSSFPLNVGLALAGLLGNFVVIESRFRLLYPWALPAAIENLAGPLLLGWGTRATPSQLLVVMVVALAGVAAATTVGVWALARRPAA